jgi:hypothetical protein
MGNLVIKQSEQQKNQLILANIPSKERKLIVLYLDTKKIRNYNPEEHSKFHDFIKMICRNSGIKEMEVNNNTHTLQIDLIHSFLRENFADFSAEEIKKAFDMAFAQIFTEIDVNHYGMPTPLWFGRILSAYKQKLNLELIKFTRQIEKSNLLSEPEISEIESDNIMALSIIESFNDYKLNKTIGDSGNAKFNFLSKKGFIVLSEKQKQDLMIRAEKSILDNSLLPKSERTIFMTVVDSLKGGLPADKLRIEARKISLRDYYDLIISNKDNINQILHNYLIKK